jgi:hypothetical protein
VYVILTMRPYCIKPVCPRPLLIGRPTSESNMLYSMKRYPRCAFVARSGNHILSEPIYCVEPHSRLRQRHADRHIVSPRRHGCQPLRARGPSPWCRAPVHGERRPGDRLEWNAVAGMNCATPCAPARLTAAGSNRLSCQISRAKKSVGRSFCAAAAASAPQMVSVDTDCGGVWLASAAPILHRAVPPLWPSPQVWIRLAPCLRVRSAKNWPERLHAPE